MKKENPILVVSQKMYECEENKKLVYEISFSMSLTPKNISNEDNLGVLTFDKKDNEERQNGSYVNAQP